MFEFLVAACIGFAVGYAFGLRELEALREQSWRDAMEAQGDIVMGRFE